MSDQDDTESSPERRKHSRTVQCTHCGHWLQVGGRGMRSSKSKKSKKSESNKPKVDSSPVSVKTAMFFGACIASLVLLGGFTFWYIAFGKGVKQSPQEGLTAASTVVKRERVVQSQTAQPLSDATAVTEVLSKYFKAHNWKERLPLVRKTPQIEEKMEQWYAWHKDAPFSRVALDKSIAEIGGYYVVKLHGDDLPSDHVVIEKTQQGYLIDWESFVIFQERDWMKIQEEKSNGLRVIRCKLELAENNHQKLTDEKGYKCYKLTHPVTGETMLAYYNLEILNQKNPESGRGLRGDSKGRYTLGVMYLDEDLIIAKVLAKGWVIR